MKNTAINKQKEDILNIFDNDVFNIIDEDVRMFFKLMLEFKPELLEGFKFESISDVKQALKELASRS